jgi:amino acid adenylation domain-containing protein
MRQGLLYREASPAGAEAQQYRSIGGRIEYHAQARPQHPALVDGTIVVTYDELDRRANKLAKYLQELGAKPESCVALLLERSADFVVAALAVLKTGAAYLPLDSSTPADRVAFILKDAAAQLVVSHRGKARSLISDLADDEPWHVVEIDGPNAQEIEEQPAAGIEYNAGSENLAYVIYTSGSTGQPKGVEITHANLANLIDWHQSAFGVIAQDRASQVAGVGFDAAVWEIWPHLTAGATLHIADELTRRSPQALRDWIVAQQITIAFVPTVLAEQLLHSTWPPETALRTFLTGADTLHRRPTADLPFVLVNNYGPTECTVVATSGVISSDAHNTEAPSIGRPIAGATVLILDENLHPVPTGESGELCIAGDLVGRGYRNNPQLTATRFVTYHPPSGPPLRIYRTGDRAKLLPNGEFAFGGRIDDQVKIRGYRVELGEIASRLDRFPGIDASAVTATASKDSGLELTAYLVTEKNLNASDVRQFLAEKLSDYMIPARFVKVASLPMTPNGKLDKSALPAPSPENLLPGGAESAPATTGGLQKQIADLVASLLGQPSVGPTQNFFMIGGHSMLGVQLVARIRDTFGVKLTLRQLFKSPTVEALATEVQRLTQSGQ